MSQPGHSDFGLTGLEPLDVEGLFARHYEAMLSYTDPAWSQQPIIIESDDSAEDSTDSDDEDMDHDSEENSAAEFPETGATQAGVYDPTQFQS
jgi:hypothetical protein